MKTAILVQVLGIYLVSGQLTSGPNQRDRDPVPSRDDHEKEQVQHNIGGATRIDETTKFVPLEVKPISFTSNNLGSHRSNDRG